MAADIATLLAEAPWLARLARSLTGDEAEADDIVQETYAAALRSPPETDRPIRPWLRQVVVNLARMRNRGSTRRAANEQVIEAQLEPVRTPDELLERAQLEHRLAELVIALDEPFRTTVLLRYREGLTAEQIAKQQGIPAGTVRGRLKTGLDRLRRELDGTDRAKLRAVFAPLVAATRPRPTPAPTLWSIVMAKLTSKVGVALLLLLLLLGGGATLIHNRRATAPSAAHEPVAVSSAAHAVHEARLATIFVQPGIGARHVRGRVTSDAAPFRGAIVRLIHAETQLMIGETTSAANGTFDLGERAADVYVVTASAPERAAVPVRLDLRAPSTPTIELRLAGCSHLRGTIVDGSGSPIDHARIARDDAAIPFAESDANGRYDLCTNFGNKTIRYSASGYQSVLADLTTQASTTLDVVLIPEAVVEGTVVTEDGAPVSGAWVVVDPSQRGSSRNARAGGFSESDGTFRITGVSPGRNLIAAFAPGLRTSHKQEIVAGAGGVTTGIIVRLVRGATISGVVVAGDVPVAGARVGMRSGNRDDTGVLAVTQVDGSFVIDRAPRGDIALYVAGYTVIAPRSVHVEGTTRVRVEVQQLGAIRGRVLRGKEPVADAQVSCPGAHVFADANGAYVCESAPDGPQELFADVPGGEWGRATVTVTRGETAELDISLTFSAAICGRVVDERGAPLQGIAVRVAERTTGDFGADTSGIDGTFCARLLSGGTYEIAVYAGPSVLEPMPPLSAVTLGPTETKRLTIAVSAPRLSITGTVSDGHGAPVVDAIIRLVAADQVGQANLDRGVSTSLTITDDTGRFSLTKLAPGSYTIIATARDGSEVVTPSVAAGSRDVAITLAAAGRIEGQLVGFTNAPTVNGVLTTDTHVMIDAEVDGTRFRASGLSPGTYVLRAVTDAHEADTQQVIVRAGEVTRVTLTSRGTATVTGVVRDFRTRAPVPGLRCNAVARQGTSLGAVFMGPDDAVPVDAQGAFRLTSPAGEIAVICGGPSRSGMRTAVAVRDRTTNVDVLTVAVGQQPGTIDAALWMLSRRIRELVKGGAADRAGLLVDDEVIAVDGVSVVDLGSPQTMLLITQRPAGTAAQLTILRGGEQRVVAVRVGASN